MKIRIKSLFLATLVAVSMSGCSLQANDEILTIEESSYEQIIDQNDLQTRMISFISKIESSDIGLDLSSFYNNAMTLRIIMDDGKELHYNSFYDKDANTLVINTSDKGDFEHELVHVILNNGKELGNVFLEEGFTELISSEVCNKDCAYAFNVGVCRILTTLLGKQKMVDTFNNKDLNVVIDGLSSIVGTREEAIEFLKYADFEHGLLSKMHESYSKTGSFDEFKQSDDYHVLQDVRQFILGKLKVYIKSYYDKKVKSIEIDSEQTLIDMLACLNIVNNDMFDGNVEGERKNDFFLKEEISYLVSAYNMNDDVYDRCYQAALTKTYIYVGGGKSKDLH